MALGSRRLLPPRLLTPCSPLRTRAAAEADQGDGAESQEGGGGGGGVARGW